VAAGAPAHADGVGMSDDAGDASGNGLDFTSVALENKAHAVVTEMSFVEDHRGRVVSASSRGARAWWRGSAAPTSGRATTASSSSSGT
jgi:hypothetical protein